jgi:hypothetical protein
MDQRFPSVRAVIAWSPPTQGRKLLGHSVKEPPGPVVRQKQDRSQAEEDHDGDHLVRKGEGPEPDDQRGEHDDRQIASGVGGEDGLRCW